MREVFKLWGAVKPFPDPADENRQEHLKEESAPSDGCDRYTDVTDPELHFFPASCPSPQPAVLVCPGGGYSHLAWNKEGLDIASMLNLNGIAAFVLKYRCPGQRQAAHADAARAMRFIRGNAEKLGINSQRVGAIGFSAGGHLVATISAPSDPVPYEPVDELDRFPYRPNFSALIYPAYLADDAMNIMPEFKVDETVPPTFLVQAEDDFARVENSLAWYLALKRAGVAAEMHLYAEGAHGYGLNRTGKPIAEWGALAGNWFRRMTGIL